MTGRRLELPARLQLLADWVPQGAALADIGTDHGYLPVWLILHDRISSAIASDLRSGPLTRGRKTAEAYGAAERIDFRLCNGLQGIRAEETDTIVVAGMGGENIAAILAAAPWVGEAGRTLLLQPMTRAEELRSFLCANGFAIRRERLAEDRGTLYPVLEAAAGTQSLSLGRLYGGAFSEKDPLGKRYIVEQIIRLQSAVAGLNRSNTAEDRSKADLLRDVITALLEQREEWRHVNGS